MPNDPAPTGERADRRGAAVLLVAVGLIVLAATMGITSRVGSPDATGAATWVARERPAGPVLTVDGWGPSLGDGGRLRVVTAAEDDLVRLASSTDVGSVVVPVGASAVEVLGATREWTVAYRDGAAAVLVRDGALPVPGAT